MESRPKKMKKQIPLPQKRILLGPEKPRSGLTRIWDAIGGNGNVMLSLGNFGSNLLSRFSSGNELVGSLSPAFAPDHVTAHLVAQWVNVVAITFAWIGLGSLFATSSAVSGRNAKTEIWQELIPSNSEISDILKKIADNIPRDEL